MRFKGELHEVKLINFSVDINEVLPLVPKSLKVLEDKGRAIISMVDVQLKKMKPALFPVVRFDYRHVAFRLLLDDRNMNADGKPKGIFFLKSFSNRPFLNFFGNLLSKYNLTNAKVEEYFDAVSLKQEDNYVDYALDPYAAITENATLFQKIHRIDRAYATEQNNIFVTKIARKHWPIEPIKCYHFATNFFKTAKFLGAFRVKDVIDYTWNNPKLIK